MSGGPSRTTGGYNVGGRLREREKGVVGRQGGWYPRRQSSVRGEARPLPHAMLLPQVSNYGDKKKKPRQSIPCDTLGRCLTIGNISKRQKHAYKTKFYTQFTLYSRHVTDKFFLSNCEKDGITFFFFSNEQLEWPQKSFQTKINVSIE